MFTFSLIRRFWYIVFILLLFPIEIFSLTLFTTILTHFVSTLTKSNFTYMISYKKLITYLKLHTQFSVTEGTDISCRTGLGSVNRFS